VFFTAELYCYYVNSSCMRNKCVLLVILDIFVTVRSDCPTEPLLYALVALIVT